MRTPWSLLDSAPASEQDVRHGLRRSSTEHVNRSDTALPRRTGARTHLVRAIALACACSLSIGSHYASYILGPLKTRLSREMGTSNTEFSLLIAAFSLNSTWTPLLGGFLAGHLGTTVTSMLATGLIFLGQIILLFGDMIESVRLMTFGMFIFGLGVSPLAVVQESIIVRFFKDHGLGLSMALGLVVGKASSFVSARTSYPLSEAFGPRAPFVAATSLAALSFVMNLVYLSASKWLVKSSGTELEASELHQEARVVGSLSEAQALKQVAKKRTVHIRDITKLGDVFWAYIGLNILCGAIWSPFTHLAANIFEKRYGLSERESSNDASFLLAGSVFLYPLCGYFIDRMKHRPILHQLFLLSSILTALCYFWLVLPPKITGTPVPAVAFYGIGQGFAPLLLVIIVPTLVSSKYVPTTLGAHKSLEQTGTTIFQTFAGLFLDKLKKGSEAQDKASELDAIQKLLGLFLLLNVFHFFSIIGLWALDRRRKRQAAEVERRARLARLEGSGAEGDDDEDQLEESIRSSPKSRRKLSLHAKEHTSESHSLQRREASASSESTITPLASGSAAERAAEEEAQPLLNDEPLAYHTNVVETPATGEAQTRSEHLRGEVFGVIGILLIAFAWVFFIGTAFLRLRAKKDREST
ncbi:MFS general substrate transporter [Fomitiporia mediterranea MF3/22]|uniref:MFS general substrate transporter n=1 Tax=Fomitiporia mediterranea (strain MF3/22) TaxID=694068 RepID=UPI00044078AC|nr:MFS general substrate transporter [Fomitiporia mediterranea MF3/22]EJD03945.1 MFS general substrate transporter [Fomitiporia mediterranea MF3/22]